MNSRIILPLVVALGLTHCNKAPTETAASSTGLNLVTEGVSPHFQAVASKLDIGGASFTYSEEEATMKMLAGFFESALDALPAEEKTKLPPGFTIKKIFALLGLDSIKASGTSSRAVTGGANHNRSFAFTPQGRKGLLSLTGGAAAPLLVRELAAKDTDLAIEFPLFLKSLATESWPMMLNMVPAAERPMIEAMAEQKQPPFGMSYREMAEKIDLRLAIIATLSPDKPITIPGSPISYPGADLAIVIDRLGWLKDALKQNFMPMLTAAGGPIEATDKDGIVSGKFRAPMMPAPMDFQPAFLLDDKADRLIIASRPEYLATLLVKENKLVGQPEFDAAWKGLPTEGNGCIYASSRFLQTFTQSMKQSAAASDPKSAEMAGKVFDMLAQYLKGPQAVCYANQPDGILSVGNVSLPSANPASISSITTIAVLSSLAVPAFNSVQRKGGEMKELNSGKQIAIALKQYAADHGGKYPPTIQTLATENILTDERLLTFKGQPWLYDSTLTDTSPGRSIILAAPTPTQVGTRTDRLVVRHDGSAEYMPDDLFQSAKEYNLK